ncbi:MAG: hypothetical protein EA423_01145 [Phycisphaerales bacterium]|nr:MAG: hypothetical protein EA423_01145 [Phycisphaerales bacterium]
MATMQPPGPDDEKRADFGMACVGCGMLLPIRICAEQEHGALVACAFCAEHYRAAIDPGADEDARASIVLKRSGGLAG